MVSPEDKAMQARTAKAKEAALALVRLRIKARMAETGISMAKLATRANVTPRMVQRFLADTGRDVQLGNIAAIAEALLLDVRDLLDPDADADGEHDL